MSKIRFKFDKLVRDNILSELQNSGVEVEYEKLAGQVFITKLKHKLIEEINEFVVASQNEIIFELADIYEVLSTIAKTCDVSFIMIQEHMQVHHSITELQHELIDIGCQILSMDSSSELTSKLHEISDILRIFLNLYNISIDDLESVRNEKAEKKGGFSKGLFIHSITCDENSVTATYCKSQPKQYLIYS